MEMEDERCFKRSEADIENEPALVQAEQSNGQGTTIWAGLGRYMVPQDIYVNKDVAHIETWEAQYSMRYLE